jgi:hypothetical protein
MSSLLRAFRKKSPFVFLGLAAMAVLTSGQSAPAFAPEGDLMKVKGYSPEVIKVTDQQRSRQEWKEPAILRQKPMEKFLRNFYYGEWTNGIDDFGSQVIRDN